MRLKDFSLLVIFCLISVPAFSQFTISGYITDLATGDPMPEVEIYEENSGKSYQPNEKGYFQIPNLSYGKYNLFFFALGYEITNRVVQLGSDSEILNIKLNKLSGQLSEVAVVNQREQIFSIKRLREVEGTSIYAGKKNEVVNLSQMTVNTSSNNARQIYSQISGLNIFESDDAGLQLNIGGRGLDPNRSSNFNIRQNGYDISADVLGYPESYYTPPAEALEEIQVIRGAASLQYGTQFGGLVNFRMKSPVEDKAVKLTTRQSIGSNALFTSHNSVSGTYKKLGYLGYYNYKNGNSFRPNSEFRSDNIYLFTEYALSDKTSLSADFTYLGYLAQQPGGLTDAQFYNDPEFSNRERNWFEVDWKLASLKLDHRFTYQSRLSITAFGLNASRKSVGFRTNRVSQQDDPNEPRDLILGDFNNWGIETRFLQRYKLGSKNAVFLIGSKYYQSKNTSVQGPGTASSEADFSLADDEFPNYPRQSDFTFPNQNLAFFGEHIFYVKDNFSITPGFRFEYIKTQSEGSYKRVNFDLAGNPIQNQTFEEEKTFERNFVLLGIGLSYQPDATTDLYGNFSQNYRSVTFNDIRIINPSFQVDPNITDESGFSSDLGIRGTIGDVISYDVGVFGLLYENRLGEVLRAETRTNADGEQEETGRIVRFRGNIGEAFMYGLESLIEIDLFSVFNATSSDKKLTIFANTAVTHSEYLNSEIAGIKGNDVEFVPTLNLKTGINFGFKNLLGSVQYTYISKQFTDASNALQNVRDNQSGIKGEIPAYDVLDLSLSWTYKQFSLESGVNNILNSSYFTRRATGYPGPGIIPSPPRTFYATLQVKI
ncbi:MAG: TonB-dependent receptor [Balneola sp.]|nr:TonB-dependent receptor [Balneola sp.]MBO6650055.1 TonB-dependent receptor [Balneola sp.]MBO6711595.1 TonB-dependent receptor [Balneola sp.]MBO6799791.1 TonB-dependent receptor [Balneola sp.]MBO6870768.1 TonB-dependent receptor [Balneola sp.]